MPIVSGLSSGSVPFVCRLFPLHPGYVMTVCAVAIVAQLSAANKLCIANILSSGTLALFAPLAAQAVGRSGSLFPSSARQLQLIFACQVLTRSLGLRHGREAQCEDLKRGKEWYTVRLKSILHAAPPSAEVKHAVSAAVRPCGKARKRNS